MRGKNGGRIGAHDIQQHHTYQVKAQAPHFAETLGLERFGIGRQLFVGVLLQFLRRWPRPFPRWLRAVIVDGIHVLRVLDCILKLLHRDNESHGKVTRTVDCST